MAGKATVVVGFRERYMSVKKGRNKGRLDPGLGPGGSCRGD